ncbi:hypothetical protein ECANGB1_1522 [Enterospora canceri]|uniref:Uncharacterized protein n=1 Tax=Enterospora canceri TaxID=1081671 RepID=A0A1Y1S723_9MICR|nr:hypothetical protein ECANGB1_1522 [Enterospora canceri]
MKSDGSMDAKSTARIFGLFEQVYFDEKTVLVFNSKNGMFCKAVEELGSLFCCAVDVMFDTNFNVNVPDVTKIRTRSLCLSKHFDIAMIEPSIFRKDSCETDWIDCALKCSKEVFIVTKNSEVATKYNTVLLGEVDLTVVKSTKYQTGRSNLVTYQIIKILNPTIYWHLSYYFTQVFL